MITQLRCPNCNAPVDIAPGATRNCRYCGASLVVDAPVGAPSKGFRTEMRFVVVARLGPSNAERVVSTLTSFCAMSSADAARAVRDGKCEIDAGTDRGRAELYVSKLVDAGADAEVVSREIAIRTVAVLLEEVGPKRTSVITAIVNHVDRKVVTLADAIRLVAHAPCTVIDAIDEEKGRALLAALEKAGARASMR